jgi:hypothetical protein
VAFYFLKILLYTQLKSIQSHNISTILAHGDASKKYEINNHEMTLVTAAMTLIIFIEKNDFQSNFQILAGSTKNAQISSIQNIFMETAMRILVSIKNEILIISPCLLVAFDIS